MQTPKRVTLEGFYQARVAYLNKQTSSSLLTGRVVCDVCGTQIQVASVPIEIHYVAAGRCVGEGEEFEAGIPYCPRCEALPESRGCVHV